MADWLGEAATAVSCWRTGKPYGDLKAGDVGMCARLAREVWEHVHGRNFPYRAASANAMGAKVLKAHHDHARGVRAVIGGKSGNAYHRALGLGAMKPGALVFFNGCEPYGHVAVVVQVGDGAERDLSKVLCVENTSSKLRGPGTVLRSLKSICGTEGSDRVWMVATVEVKP